MSESRSITSNDTSTTCERERATSRRARSVRLRSARSVILRISVGFGCAPPRETRSASSLSLTWSTPPWLPRDHSGPMARPSDSADSRAQFVSTGSLPPPDLVQALVAEAHERYRSIEDGANSDVYPALERVAPELFGVCAVGTRGAVHSAGDAEVEFSIMSVSKPFVFALVCQAVGPDEVRERVGVNATGLEFN